MDWLTNLREGLDTPPHQAAAVLATTLLVLVLVYFLKRLLLKAAARAPDKIDSSLIQRLYRPVRVSVLVYGFIKSFSHFFELCRIFLYRYSRLQQCVHTSNRFQHHHC